MIGWPSFAFSVQASMAAVTSVSSETGKLIKTRRVSEKPGTWKVLPMTTCSPSSAATSPAGLPPPCASVYSAMSSPMITMGLEARIVSSAHDFAHPPTASCTPGVASTAR
jgi:hypothetical protein